MITVSFHIPMGYKFCLVLILSGAGCLVLMFFFFSTTTVPIVSEGTSCLYVGLSDLTSHFAQDLDWVSCCLCSP